MSDVVNDKDLENLEAFLDGALELDASDQVQARLEYEPKLADALEMLRAQRAMRRAMWDANEPAPIAVMRLNASLDKAISHADRSVFWRTASRWGTAAAACVLMGIWIGNSTLPGSAPRSGESVAASAGAVPVAVTPAAEWNDGYHVSILDNAGHVQAVQRFSTLEQAREFANDLGRWQTRQQQVRQGKIQLVADQF